jgi:hypothetical protein
MIIKLAVIAILIMIIIVIGVYIAEIFMDGEE